MLMIRKRLKINGVQEMVSIVGMVHYSVAAESISNLSARPPHPPFA